MSSNKTQAELLILILVIPAAMTTFPIVRVTAAVRSYSASINLTGAFCGETDVYVVTLTNDPSSTGSIGSATISIPSGFTSTSILSVSNTWTGTIDTTLNQIKITGGNQVNKGESVSVTFTSTAPTPASPPQSYTWTTAAFGGGDYSTNPFTLIGALQPTVTVTCRTTATVTETTGTTVYSTITQPTTVTTPITVTTATTELSTVTTPTTIFETVTTPTTVTTATTETTTETTPTTIFETVTTPITLFETVTTPTTVTTTTTESTGTTEFTTLTTPTTVYQTATTTETVQMLAQNGAAYVWVGAHLGPIRSTKPAGTMPAAWSDSTAAALVLGMLTNPKFSFDIDPTTVDQLTGQPKPGPISVFVMSGGPFVNGPVKFYETNYATTLTPVHFGFAGSNYAFYDASNMIIPGTSVNPTSLGTSLDYFLIESFVDNNGNNVLIIYGYGGRGTFAAALYFKEQLYPGPGNTLSPGYQIVQWNDTNGNGLPEFPQDSFTQVYHSP